MIRTVGGSCDCRGPSVLSSWCFGTAWRMAAWQHGAKVAIQRLGILTAFAPSIAKLRQGEVTLVLSLLVDVFIRGTT